LEKEIGLTRPLIGDWFVIFRDLPGFCEMDGKALSLTTFMFIERDRNASINLSLEHSGSTRYLTCNLVLQGIYGGEEEGWIPVKLLTQMTIPGDSR